MRRTAKRKRNHEGGVANGIDERRMSAGGRRDGRLVAAGAAKLRRTAKRKPSSAGRDAAHWQ